MAGAVHNPNGIQLYSHRPHWGGEHCLGLFFWFTCTWLTVSGSSKVASCQRKLPPTWLVQPATLLGISLQIVLLKWNIRGLAADYDNSAVYFKTFWQPYCILMTGQCLRSMVPSQVHQVSHLDKRYMFSLLFTKRGSSPCVCRELQTSSILIWSGMHSCSDWVW